MLLEARGIADSLLVFGIPVLVQLLQAAGQERQCVREVDAVQKSRYFRTHVGNRDQLEIVGLDDSDLVNHANQSASGVGCVQG